jgi:hypothetical protein
MATAVYYATVDQVKRSAEIASAANADQQIRRALESASRSIDGDRPGGGTLGRRFYPYIATRYVDWLTNWETYELKLGRYDLVTLTALSIAGTTVTPSTLQLVPDDGPPYATLRLTSSSEVGSWSTTRRANVLTGTWGYRADETSIGAITLVDTTSTGLTLHDPDVGVGTILHCGTEYMIVTTAGFVSSGQALAVALTAYADDDAVSVADGSVFSAGSVILLNTETMLVTAVTGNVLTVERAWDGSTLADHTGSTVYARWSYTVTRGDLGSTAAAHAAVTAYRYVVPALVSTLCVAEAVEILQQEGAAYARAAGPTDQGSVTLGLGLDGLRERVKATYRRRTSWLGA